MVQNLVEVGSINNTVVESHQNVEPVENLKQQFKSALTCVICLDLPTDIVMACSFWGVLIVFEI